MVSSVFLFIKDILEKLIAENNYDNDEIIYDHNDEIEYFRSGDLNE